MCWIVSHYFVVDWRRTAKSSCTFAWFERCGGGSADWIWKEHTILWPVRDLERNADKILSGVVLVLIALQLKSISGWSVHLFRCHPTTDDVGQVMRPAIFSLVETYAVHHPPPTPTPPNSQNSRRKSSCKSCGSLIDQQAGFGFLHFRINNHVVSS